MLRCGLVCQDFRDFRFVVNLNLQLLVQPLQIKVVESECARKFVPRSLKYSNDFRVRLVIEIFLLLPN